MIIISMVSLVMAFEPEFMYIPIQSLPRELRGKLVNSPCSSNVFCKGLLNGNYSSEEVQLKSSGSEESSESGGHRDKRRQEEEEESSDHVR